MKHIISLFAALMLLLSAALAENNRYDDLGLYGEYDMWPVQRDGLWGFVDQHGELILPCEWEEVGMVVDGRAPVQKNGLWGVIDRTGKQIVPCEWGGASVDFYGGLLVLDVGTYGAMNIEGEMLIPCGLYNAIGPAIDGVRHILKDAKAGLCTTEGEIITPCQWQDTGYFSEGLAWVTDEHYAWGYINMAGEQVIPCQYGQANDFVSGSAVVRLRDGGYQLIDQRGNLLCQEPWDEMEYFTANDLIMVRKGDKYGFINRKGEVAIPLIYDRAQEFGDGLALVKLGEDTFWIDKSGEKALDRPEGYTSFPFRNGLAAIRNAEGFSGLMDKQGHFVTPCQWENHLTQAFAQDNIAVFSKAGQTCFLNMQSEMISGRMYELGTIKHGMDGDVLFLLENGVLSIWSSDGTKVY